MHVDQCIDTLRMSLMCHGDTTPMLITQDRDMKSGYKADLNGHAKCRNFSKLQAWTESHGIEHWKTDSDFHNHGDRTQNVVFGQQEVMTAMTLVKHLPC